MTVTLHINKIVLRIFTVLLCYYSKSFAAAQIVHFHGRAALSAFVGTLGLPQSMCRSIMLEQWLVQILVAE